MKTVVIALPGDSYSGAFLKNWTNAFIYLQQKGYNLSLIHI